jgi:hypothetical protein
MLTVFYKPSQLLMYRFEVQPLVLSKLTSEGEKECKPILIVIFITIKPILVVLIYFFK